MAFSCSGFSQGWYWLSQKLLAREGWVHTKLVDLQSWLLFSPVWNVQG